MTTEHPEDLKRKAYVLGFKMLNTNLDEETIYAKIEKQGIPEDIAREVAKDVMLERNANYKKNDTQEDVAWIKLIFAALALIISIVLFPGYFILPIGLIIGGLSYFILRKQ